MEEKRLQIVTMTCFMILVITTCINLIITTLFKEQINMVFWMWEFVTNFMSLGLIGYLIYIFQVNIYFNYKRFLRRFYNFILGNKMQVNASQKKGYFAKAHKDLDILEDNLLELENFAKKIGEGEFDVELSKDAQRFSLTKTLLEMKNRLQELQKEEEQRNWTIRGIAEFSHILRNNNNFELAKTTNTFISYLIKYIKAQQGAVFVINNEKPVNKFLELMASYAYNATQFEQKKRSMEDGFLGECIRRKKNIKINDIPETYTQITSGLGQTIPRNILLVPIIFKDIVYGVVEISTLEILEDFKIELIETVTRNLAVAFDTFYTNQNTQNLLKETTAIKDELMTREQIMLENIELLDELQNMVENQRNTIEQQNILIENLSKNATTHKGEI